MKKKRSKTSKINEATDYLLDTMRSYALLAREWDMNEEDDFQDFKEEVIEILETYIK